LGLEQDLRRRSPSRARGKSCSSSWKEHSKLKGQLDNSLSPWPGRASAAPGRGPCLEAMPVVPHPSPQTECRALARFPSGPLPSGWPCPRQDQDPCGQQEQQAGHSLPLSQPLVLFQVWFDPLSKGGVVPLSRSC